MFLFILNNSLKILIKKIYLNFYIYIIKIISYNLTKKTTIIHKIFYQNSCSINLNKSQFFFTCANNNLRCLWTLSSGIFLKKILLKTKKNLKKKKNFNLGFLKKIFDLIIKKKLITSENILILKGFFFKFVQFFLFLQKINFLNLFNIIIIQSKLSYGNIKAKKIKAIKRKLLKRLIKLKN